MLVDVLFVIDPCWREAPASCLLFKRLLPLDSGRPQGPHPTIAPQQGVDRIIYSLRNAFDAAFAASKA